MTTPTEHAHLWDAMHAGSSAARDQLAAIYEPFARRMAWRALRRAPEHQDVDDLISYAHHALLDSLAKFRPEAGVKFETYATRRITGGIKDELRRQDPLTRGDRQRVTAQRKAREAFWEEHSREPSPQELAAVLGVTAKHCDTTAVMAQTMTEDIDEHEDLADMIEADDRGESLESELCELIIERLQRLTPVDRSFLALYYIERLRLPDIGKIAQLSDVRCGQLRRKAIHALPVR